MFPIHDDAPRTNGRPFVNYGLIAINVIVFIYEAFVTSFFSSGIAQFNLFLSYGSVPNLILSGQNLGSLITSMFMHGSIAHLMGNMFFLYVFGDNLEGRFGHYRYLLIYLIWGIIASLAHGIYSVSTGNGGVPAIGASGAISGVLGAYLIFFPRAKIHTIIFAFFITTVRIPALAYIPFWFIMQMIFALIGQSGGVAYVAHIGGFLAGIGTAFAWKTFSHLFERSLYAPQTKNKSQQYPSLKNEIADYDTPPEVLVGNGFLDVIVQVRGVETNSDIQAKYDDYANRLDVEIRDLNKTYSIDIPNTAKSVFEVSSVSVINGIIKIRLYCRS
jgi:membrane associated rhomboid family serine protease